MHATVWPSRIDILGSSGVAKDAWEPLLDELKAKHVPSFTPTGKRMTVVLSPSGRLDAFIYRTVDMADEEAIRILGKYGIQATVGSENVASI